MAFARNGRPPLIDSPANAPGRLGHGAKGRNGDAGASFLEPLLVDRVLANSLRALIRRRGAGKRLLLWGLLKPITPPQPPGGGPPMVFFSFGIGIDLQCAALEGWALVLGPGPG